MVKLAAGRNVLPAAQYKGRNAMIKVTRLKAKDEFVLNAELIEMIEETPDTVVTLTNGKKLIVEESMEELVRKVMQYRRAIFNNFR